MVKKQLGYLEVLMLSRSDIDVPRNLGFGEGNGFSDWCSNASRYLFACSLYFCFGKT